jgi:Bardet-Biedl syndrome 2 protein
VSTNNNSVVRAVVIFGDQLFTGESLFHCPKQQLSEVKIPLSPPKDVACDLFLKVFVGLRNSQLFNVFEQNYKMPKFAMYVPLGPDSKVVKPEGNVTFALPDKMASLVTWLNNSFNIMFDHKSQDDMSVGFKSLRDDRMLFVTTSSGKVSFWTENMELAGDLVQDLAEYTHTEQLSSRAHFPEAMNAFKQVLERVEEFNQTRLALAAGAADVTNNLKELVVKAEDSRMMGDLKLMKRTYARLWDLNRELLGEHAKRRVNQDALLEALKHVNQVRLCMYWRAYVRRNLVQGIKHAGATRMHVCTRI